MDGHPTKCLWDYVTYYCRSEHHQTKCLWDHFTYLLLPVGAAPDQVPVGPCYTLTVAGRCITRPSACGTMLHTYCRRSVRHQTKCLWDHVTHLLLQVGAAPDQVPVGPFYTLTIAGRCGTRPSACGTMLHTYYCRSVRHQTKCLWDHVTLTIAGRCVTRPSACGTMLHTYCRRSVRHQTKCLWDHVTLTIAGRCGTRPSACGTMPSHLLFQVGASPDQVPVGPCYTLTIAGQCGTRPSACGIMLHTYYCRSVRPPDQVPVGPDPPHVLSGIPTSQSVPRITRIGGDRPIRHLSA